MARPLLILALGMGLAHGPEVTASCAVDIDEASPLFVAAQAILDVVNQA